MLGKLMKYEFMATWKLLVPMDIFLILMSILACITVHLSFFSSDNELVEITGMIIVVTYMLSMFVIVIGTVIYLIYRFYTSVYGDEGYLLHTLPVDKHHIIISKVIASVAWIVLNIVLIYFSLVFLFGDFVLGSGADSVREGLKFYLRAINGYDKINAFSIFMTLLASFVLLLARILKITACISLGQLSSNHKVLVSFGFYYGIYAIQRIFTIIYYVMISLAYKANDDISFTSSLLGRNWEFSLISGLIYCVVFYFLTWYVMDKKLNLD